MKPGIETREEYMLSKYLLLKYVNSPQVVEQLGTLMASHMVLFLRKYIDPHESKFLFYLRKNVRHYGEYSNTIHDGTNNAIKHSTTPVKPSFVLSHTFKLINTQAKMSNTRKRYESSKHFYRINTRLDDMCKINLNQLAIKNIKLCDVI